MNYEFLKKLQDENPIHPNWAKRDYVSIFDCVFVFYDIEPIEPHEIIQKGFGHDYYGLLKSFDVEKIFEIIQNSNLPIYNGRIILKEFIQFLKNKNLNIPKLFKSEKNDEVSNSEYEELKPLIVGDLNVLTLTDLRNLVIRALATYFRKNDKNLQKVSAAKLAQDKHFLDAISFVDAQNQDPKGLAEKISDLGPRSRKKRA